MIMITVGERQYKMGYSMFGNTLYFENHLRLAQVLCYD